MLVRSLTTPWRVIAISMTLVLAAGALGLPGVARGAITELFFSEYVEGSSNNKALEIYNGTGAPVDLAAGGYNVQVHFNGNPAAGLTINLTGTVADGDVFVLAHSSAAAAIQAEADQTTGAGLFNGDDAVVLRRGSEPIDVIGQVGFDPGSQWGSGLTSTADNTIRRMESVEAGDADGSDAFDPSAEWVGFAQDTFDGLGCWGEGSCAPAATDPTGTGAADPATVSAGDSTLLTVEVTPGTNPDSTGLAVTADLSAIGGSASQQLFDDGSNGDATAGDLVFSYEATVAAGTSPGVKSLPATITDDQAREGSTSISLTVEGEPVAIWEIQGSSHTSPYAGQTVSAVEGVVTATSGNGYWMTDPTPDTDPGTSDGIFVFRGSSATKPQVGDAIRATGPVVEFRPGGSGGFENLTLTEISTPNSFVVTSSENPLPTTVVGVDRLPPTLVIDDDSTGSVEDGDAVYDPATDGIDFWESLEGMRLEVADAAAVGPRNNFGEIAVISALQTDAGVRTPRGGIIVRELGPDGDYRPGDFNPERLILDDVLASTPFVNAGDAFEADPVGVLDYSFGNFKLLVTGDPGRVDNGLQRESTVAQGPRDLAVATYNVENLSVVNDQAKFDELAGQIVNNLRAPDIIGIEEMQDDSGPTNDGTVSAAAGWQRLIDAIVAAGGPLYQFRSIDPANNADGGQPGGNIRVGFLYREDRGVVFVDRPGGDAVTDADVVATPNGEGAQLTISPGRVLDSELDDEKAFAATRKSLAGEFRFRGETIFVVVNHFSSKGDDHPLFAHFQPPVRLTELESGDPEDGWRHAQAQVVNDFVDEILAVDDDAHVVVLGDINDFDFSETVEVLTGERVAVAAGQDVSDPDGSGPTAPSGEPTVLRTLFEQLPANERYSYVFDGNSQVLDQILVTHSLWDLGVAYDVVHVNAEFAEQTSDHDPSVARVAFQPRRGE